MTELYIVYTLIISLVLILSAGLYYFYTKFNQLEGEISFVKNSFNDLEVNQDEVGSNFGSDLEHFVSDDESESGDDDEATQLKLAEDFYHSLTNNQGSEIVQFDEPIEKDLNSIEELPEPEEVKPKRKYNKKKVEEDC